MVVRAAITPGPRPSRQWPVLRRVRSEAAGVDVAKARPAHGPGRLDDDPSCAAGARLGAQPIQSPAQASAARIRRCRCLALMGVADFDEFNSRMVLASPRSSRRVRPAPVRMPLPPADHQGSIYENQRGSAVASSPPTRNSPLLPIRSPPHDRARHAFAMAGRCWRLRRRAAQSNRWTEWLSAPTPGTARFYRSIPLEDIVPPPASRASHMATVRLRPPGSRGTQRRRQAGHFAANRRRSDADRRRQRDDVLRSLAGGVALLIRRRPGDAPLASLTVRPNQLGTEALFTHARRQLLATVFHRHLHVDRRRRDPLGLRRAGNARPHMAGHHLRQG